ncbi:Leucine-rich repeat-containing protein 71 [Kappamyces sp. JEL0680]|nr:Leucine-rich repeat-containing protein 71 [Kappamyces sp. JEL0680]
MNGIAEEGNSHLFDAVAALELSGNFETDYQEACRKLGVKPLHLLKFGPVLPPLPLKETDIEATLSLKNSMVSLVGRKSLVTIIAPDEETPTVPLSPTETTVPASAPSPAPKNSIPTRRVLNERRENSIQEYLKKSQLEFGSSANLLASTWVRNKHPYSSRYKFTPTINLEYTDSEEMDGEILYKMELRGHKIPVGNLEVLARISHNSLSSLTNLTIWNGGLTDQHFQLVATLISNGPIRHVALDANPGISETSYASLLGDEAGIRTLSVRAAKIGDPGARSIATALKTNRVLVGLDLFDNKIQKFGAEAIGEALKSNATLQSLSLAKNHIGDDGILYLSKGLGNIPLSSEEVAQRKKLVSDVPKQSDAPADSNDDPKKKGGLKKAGSQQTLKTDKKNLKPAAAAAPPVAGKKDPNPPKAAKTPEADPKTKKLTASISDEKKPIKKGAAQMSTKGKKGGKDDAKDEIDDTPEVSVEPMFEINNQWFVLGNRALNSLNVSLNGITDIGVKHLLDVLLTQESSLDQTPDGVLGLFRIALNYNSIPQDNAGLAQLNALLTSRNPFFEPSEETEAEDDGDDNADDVDEVDESNV